MNPLSIVPYDESHRDAVLKITEEAWGPVFAVTETQVPQFVLRNFFPNGWMPRQKDEVSELLTDEGDHFWIGLIGGEIAGFVGLRIHPDDSMGEIYIIAVSPRFQRTGLARLLIDHSENIIRERGMKMVMVETIGDDGHEPARRTYEALGFVSWPVARYFKPLG